MQFLKKSKHSLREFPGGLVVRTLSITPNSLASIPGQGMRIPQAVQPKNKK